MTLVRVAYGRLYGADLDAQRCPRCKSTGREFGGECPRCAGTGDDPANGFTYSTQETLSLGDIVLVGVNRYREPYREIEATVLGMGSVYVGPVKPVVRVLERGAS